MANIIIGSLFCGPPQPEPPGIPGTFTATATSASTIDLSWTASTGTAPITYVIEWSPNGSSGWGMVDSTVETSLTDSGLAPETPYYYRISATNSDGTSDFATANATTLETFLLSLSPSVIDPGWATMGIPLAPGDLPAGLKLSVAGLPTQTDILSVWPDSSAKHVAVTCKPTNTGSLNVTVGSPATGSFTPTIPTASATFSVKTRFTLLGDFSITSGTLKVRARNIYAQGSSMVADAILIEALDGSGNPTGTSYVVDNSDGSPSYVETGSWNNGAAGYRSALNWGYGHSARMSEDNSATATWTKSGLPSGTYRVSASWKSVLVETNILVFANSYKIGYEVFDDTTTRGEIPFSQHWNAGESGGTVLGDFSIASGTCNVVLTNDSAYSAPYLVFGDRVALYKDGALTAYKSYGDSGIVSNGFSGTGSHSAVGDASFSEAVYTSTVAVGGTSTLTYTFTGLAAGTYRVMVWVPWGANSSGYEQGISGTPKARDAKWKILDDATLKGTVELDHWVRSGREAIVNYTATLPGTATADVWFDGPLCKEWRVFQNPIDAGATAHPALLVGWDVRCYSDGSCRIQIAVENTYNKAAVTEIFYDVSVLMNGSEVFAESGLDHFPLTRWTKIFHTTGLTEALIIPDLSRAYSSASKLLPKYQTGGVVDVWAPSEPPMNIANGYPRWKVLRQAGFYQPNLAVGDVTYVGPYPQWIADYLANDSAFARQYMMDTARNGYSAYPFSIRASDNHFIDPRLNPYMSIDPRTPSAYLNVNPWEANRMIYRCYLGLDLSHHPQCASVPYLITAERYLGDQIALAASWMLYGTNGGTNSIFGVECRANAWGLMCVTEAASFLSDDHEAKPWIVEAVANTFAFSQDYADSLILGLNNQEYRSSSPVAYLDFPAGIFTDEDGTYQLICAPWQMNYLLYAFQRGVDMGLLDGEPKQAVNARTRLAGNSVGMFTNCDPVEPDNPSLSVYPVNVNTNLLWNTGFFAACSDDANYMKQWTVSVGTAGTHVVQGSVEESYSQLGCLKLVSDGSTLPAIYQEFNKQRSTLANQGGTDQVLSSSSTYYFVAWMKISAADSSGSIILELVDDFGNVHNGNQFTVNVSSLTQSFVRKTFIITTGGSLPATYRLRIRFGSSPTSGRSIFIGPIGLWRTTESSSILGYPFYMTIGWTRTGTNIIAQTWDQIFANEIAAGHNGGAPWPSNDGTGDLTLGQSCAIRMGIANAAAAKNRWESNSHFARATNFRFVDGHYV